MRAVLLLFLGIISQFLGTHSLIVPDEFPSLMSVIYSNIPTIKKGTDSRMGWGFRLGNRADFQFMVELGPQTNTQPLGNQIGSNTNKREATNSVMDALYANYQKTRQKNLKAKNAPAQAADTVGGKWLTQWSQSLLKERERPGVQKIDGAPGLGIGEIDARSVIPDDSTLMLEELYKKKPTSEVGEKPKS